jgi:hypothetical protein
MARRIVDDLIAKLEKLELVFRNKTLSVGDLAHKSLAATVATIRGKNQELEEAKTLVRRLVNEVNAAVAEGRQIHTRGLSGIRAAFGPDSSEYEQAGGVRSSERKKRTTKKKAE